MFSSTKDFKDRGYRCPDLFASCFPCDCNWSCQQCLRQMCCCCCPQLQNRYQKHYPHIEYEQMADKGSEEDFDSYEALSPIKPVPVDRIFKRIPTSTQDFPVHPQVGYHDTIEEEDESGLLPITEQPHYDMDRKRHSLHQLHEQSTVSSEHSSVELTPVLQYEASPSPHSSMEDIGAELGFIDSRSILPPPPSTSITSDTPPRGRSKDNIRITRTPEGTMERPKKPRYSNIVMPQFKQQQAEPCQRGIVTSHSESALDKAFAKSVAASIYSQFVPQHPCVTFSLYYDDQHSTLIVHLIQAYKLPTKRAEEACNPFVEVYLLPRKYDIQQSSSKPRTLNPIFDQAFKFANIPTSAIESQMVVIRIYINDKTHFIGGVTFPLENVNLIGDKHQANIMEFEEDEYLKGTSQGDLLLSMSYITKMSVLEIVVLEATNLKKQDVIGLSNPYIKINLIHKGQRLIKWKTSVKKSTLMPVFNETCQLDLSNLDINAIQLDVLVMDYDRFGRNSEMGHVTLGNDVIHTSGLAHWKKVMQNVDKTHTFWHPLKPVTSSTLGSPLRTRRRSRSPSVQSCVTPQGMQI